NDDPAGRQPRNSCCFISFFHPSQRSQGEERKGVIFFRGGEWKEIDRSRTEDVHGPIPGAGQEDLARHRLPPRPPANSRAEEAEEGGEDVRVPRRAHHVGDAEGDGLPSAPGGEGGRRRRGRRGGRRRQEEEGGVEPLRLLLLRLLSSTGCDR
uniref:Uncharacterized protein n=1 Tax=Triticum urartu TaxID=4572 RepID=A0A8R7UKF1_TRIUA